VDGPSVYGYAGQSPLMWVDPEGLDWVDPMGGYYPDGGRSGAYCGFDFNPLERPELVAALMIAPVAIAVVGRAAAGAVGAAVTKEAMTVIGRVKDLKTLGAGEKSLLDRLPNLGNPKANWRQNAGVLRKEMRLGKPIRDASPGDTAEQFLNAERNLLRDRGWTFDPKTNYWSPPVKP
jgi:hypothetical protein